MNLKTKYSLIYEDWLKYYTQPAAVITSAYNSNLKENNWRQYRDVCVLLCRILMYMLFISLVWNFLNKFWHLLLKMWKICPCATRHYSSIHNIYKIPHMMSLWNLNWQHSLINTFYSWCHGCFHMTCTYISDNRLGGIKIIILKLWSEFQNLIKR